jgi:hypothetical protein
MSNGTDHQRRLRIQQRATALRDAVRAGEFCDCEALARLCEFIASELRGVANAKKLFVDDLGLVCAGRSGRTGTRNSTYMVAFGQSCFHSSYQDQGAGNNQVRHFVGFVLAGFYWKTVGGWVLLIYNELDGVFTWPDILLGEQGIDLGGDIDRTFSGTALGDVAQWIRDEICA